MFTFGHLHTLYIDTRLAPASRLQDARKEWKDEEGNYDLQIIEHYIEMDDVLYVG